MFSLRRTLSYRIQSIDLHSKSIDWCLYDRDLHHEKFNAWLSEAYLRLSTKIYNKTFCKDSGF